MAKLKFVLLISSVLLIIAPIFSPSTISETPPPTYNIHTIHRISSNWAGYVVATNLNKPQNDVITDVKGSWIVPAVVGSKPRYAHSASWIGIDGYSSHSVEQIGTESNVQNGRAVYFAWYEMFPKSAVYLNMRINAGDTISAEVKYLEPGNFLLSITDVTTGASFSTIQKSRRGLSGAPHRSSAEWIVEALFFGLAPLTDFGTAYFFNSQVTVNGVTGTINNAHWQNNAITMVTLIYKIKAQPSHRSNDGTSFSVTWHHR